ncbi:hypothetical protein [Propionibacterium phage PacnesP1]|nr:hypothetical protein [Propionibacterium phage PacnesP1]
MVDGVLFNGGVMLGGCRVVDDSCIGGFYLYRVGHGFGFCSGGHIPV